MALSVHSIVVTGRSHQRSTKTHADKLQDSNFTIIEELRAHRPGRKTTKRRFVMPHNGGFQRKFPREFRSIFTKVIDEVLQKAVNNVRLVELTYSLDINAFRRKAQAKPSGGGIDWDSPDNPHCLALLPRLDEIRQVLPA